ncbi:pentatricopeptide repeat-containing protein At2g16880-like [Salvia miltiorrhiza]|uniref:pentatricopeptide repeat-containing protein At2g16880-like n=1 Tax=Salvia miltiorrhiza TaxID=226208 RepID=UPI0025ABC5A0|nr:pentatricopeptide repeat-containing protein At2g16880-like [Salvia miltiorrhiza]
MLEDKNTPLILGRPFLATGRALIDVQDGDLTFRVNDEKLTLSIYDAMRKPAEPQMDECNMIESVIDFPAAVDDPLEECIIRLPAKSHRLGLVASAIFCFAPGLVISAPASWPLPSSAIVSEHPHHHLHRYLLHPARPLPPPSATLLNTCIFAYCRSGWPHLATQLFKKMKRLKIRPNLLTLNTLLNSLMHCLRRGNYTICTICCMV